MSIIPYLDGFKFDLETKRIMGVAFEMTRAALRLERIETFILVGLTSVFILLTIGLGINWGMPQILLK